MNDCETPLSASGQASNEDVFDLTEALQRVEGDCELLSEMAEIFLEEYPGMFVAVQQALSDQDATALRHAAHTLKGSVGNFAARLTFEAAFVLEKMGRMGDLSDASAALITLEQELARLTPVLEAFKTKVAA
jgi:HPt (histidine-containing phosphotransfer) domain-containing protein